MRHLSNQFSPLSRSARRDARSGSAYIARQRLQALLGADSRQALFDQPSYAVGSGPPVDRSCDHADRDAQLLRDLLSQECAVAEEAL